MVRTPADENLDQLQRQWTSWRIWIVRRVYGGPVWCARLRDGTGPILNAEGPEDLTAKLEAQPAEP